ncbi:MAG TPA: conjugative transposon protein TraM, partial [Puia sp.]|nr:conjugative transposon protein TraM [Puia sp.]
MMEPIHYSPRFLKHRTFMLVLPLIILPFLVILFIILGGGKDTSTGLSIQPPTGLNTRLPDAHFKKGAEKSKLSVYEEASKDSAVLKEKIKNDPYYLMEPHDSTDGIPSRHTEMQQNESKIMDKLAQLKSILHASNENTDPVIHTRNPDPVYSPTANESPISKIGNTKTHNAEIDQLNSMLDKVMAIQHPEIMQDSISKLTKSKNETAYRVNVSKISGDAETFKSSEETEAMTSSKTNRFYDLVSDQMIENAMDNGIEAIVPETQVLVSGSTVKLRILNDININGHLILKNQNIYGITTLTGERLKIQFTTLRSGNTLLPVSMEAYDMDGLTGIFIPGSINREVAKQSGDQALG